MAIAARVIKDMAVVAVIALLDMAPKRSCTALHKGAHNLPMLWREKDPWALAIGRCVNTKHIRHLKLRAGMQDPGTRVRLNRGRWLFRGHRHLWPAQQVATLGPDHRENGFW